ncbi:MAG: twin-arginine translocase subunit TatC [Candidatus Omnitrophota bacterium]|nr:MAG: twin-arginine translocase subunit TatC [Candidatus Omnitrophota bacterium]
MIRPGDKKKPFLEHLEELRKRIILILISIILLSALSYTYSEKVLRFLARYIDSLVFISPQEAFLCYLKISLFSGLVLSAPVVLFNVLKFIWVALNKREKNIFVAYLIGGIFLFGLGIFFSYYIALPAAINFLLSFSSDLIRPFISVAKYISFSIFLILAFGMAFETPLFIVLLTRSGIVNSRTLRKQRKYFIILLFIISAMLTPPDVITQVLLAVPLIMLYEISILFAGISEKRHRAGGSEGHFSAVK